MADGIGFWVRYRRWWSTMLLGFLLSANGPAAVNRSTFQGFSLAYPDGWLILPEEEVAQSQEVIFEFKQKVGGDRNDPRAVVIREPNNDRPEMATLIKVTLSINSMVISEENADMLVRQLDVVWSKLGLSVEKIEYGFERVGSNEGLHAEYKALNPLTGVQRRIWQHTAPGREQVYTISCDAPEVQAESCRDVCRSVLESFQKDIEIDGLLTTIPERWRSMIWAIIKALILIVVINWLFNRKKARELPT